LKAFSDCDKLSLMSEIKIGKRKIGTGHPVYIIAEIGLNHQGDMKLARKLIDKAIEAGADCVKFQKRSLSKVYSKQALEHPESQEHGTNYVLGHIKKTELTESQMEELFEYAKKKGVDFICTPWDEESLAFLHKIGVPAFKIASADMFNFKLLSKVAALKKPMIISTGMSFVSEIEELANFLRKLNAEYILLHCNSTYPAPYHDINLNFLKPLQSKYSTIVGYSGHETGSAVSISAITLGAKVIEKHITLDRNLPGPDHKASLLPEEFKDLVKQIRTVEMSLGEETRFPSRGEYLNREILSKSIVAGRDLKKGTVLTFEDLDVKSPGKGTNPMKLDLFVGKKVTTRDIKKDDYILESDINLRPRELYKKTKTKRTSGIVARMGDIDSLLHTNPDFIEIHLTSSDVKADKKYTKKYDFDVTFHAPEYNGDSLLDLSSNDPKIRKESVAFFNKVLNHARGIKKLFKNKDKKAKFIIHPGGMSMTGRLENADALNRNLANSLGKLKGEGFELLVENMPGLPWYFGGQWYHSNFMEAKEIAEFSKKYGYGIVFDTSHAALYCNYYGKDLLEYAKTILPVTKYIHISDAARFNGEGLQIGDGTIEWKPILDEIVKTDLWIIPEIWQGHKFGGEGFLKAIARLKELHPDF
jgi:N-acetylneuraminate synthase